MLKITYNLQEHSSIDRNLTFHIYCSPTLKINHGKIFEISIKGKKTATCCYQYKMKLKILIYCGFCVDKTL